MNRRTYLASIPALGGAGFVGCLGGENGGEQSCREETVVDDFATFSPSESVTWRIDLEAGQSLAIEAVRTGDGARPSLEVDDPNGDTFVSAGPSQRIDRTVTAQTDGRYYVRFINEAVLTSGQWDVTITARSAAC